MATVQVRPLAPNHQRVFEALRAAGRPVTAYELIEAVRDHGITAPPTVYRALTRLIESGLAHRLETLNAFVACRHTHPGHMPVAFLICTVCSRADEVTVPSLAPVLHDAAAARSFTVTETTVELRGTCAGCAPSAPA